MRKTFLLIAALGTGLVATARADVLTLPADAPAAASLVDRGMTKARVIESIGEPMRRHEPAGGDSARHPPITRWDYEGFSVFFEHTLLIDVVVKDAPAPLQNVDELQPEP